MMGELNKIFDRDFVVGHFVSAAIFLAASIGLLSRFDLRPSWLKIDGDSIIKETTVLTFICLGVALALMILNRSVFRGLEGYWINELGHHLRWLEGTRIYAFGQYLVGGQKRRFRRLKKALDLLTKERDECLSNGRKFPKRWERNQVATKLSTQFPSREDLVLPTAFGNTVRAFEDYPRVMYGFESIEGWSRLNAVLPKDYRETLAGARAITDLWVNIWFLSLILLIEYLVVVVWQGKLRHPWIPIASLFNLILAARQARHAARWWGEWVKAAFDVHLPILAKTLGYTLPSNFEQQHNLWHIWSQAVIYRHADSLRKLEEYRSHGEDGEAKLGFLADRSVDNG